jgi:hypothetical protein
MLNCYNDCVATARDCGKALEESVFYQGVRLSQIMLLAIWYLVVDLQQKIIIMIVCIPIVHARAIMIIICMIR